MFAIASPHPPAAADFVDMELCLPSGFPLVLCCVLFVVVCLCLGMGGCVRTDLRLQRDLRAMGEDHQVGLESPICSGDTEPTFGYPGP